MSFIFDCVKHLCPNAIFSTIGASIGRGIDGEVFEYEENKVIKFSISYDIKQHQRLLTALQHLIQHSYSSYVQVFGYQDLGNWSSIQLPHSIARYIPHNNFSLCSYVMERLQPITEDEYKVFHSILSHEDRGIIKNCNSGQIKKILEGLGRGLDFSAGGVILLCEDAARVPLLHLDQHPRNIMKNSVGNFKFVDLDRVKLRCMI